MDSNTATDRDQQTARLSLSQGQRVAAIATVKGSLEYHKEGEVLDDMNTWTPKQLPGNAAVALNIEEVYSGAEQLL